jgi:hypothetical protein
MKKSGRSRLVPDSDFFVFIYFSDYFGKAPELGSLYSFTIDLVKR